MKKKRKIKKVKNSKARITDTIKNLEHNIESKARITDTIKNLEHNIESKSRTNFIIPWIVFLFSISVILIIFISVIFPALILASNITEIPAIESAAPDPFETGIWSEGVIISNIIVFTLIFVGYKKKIRPLYTLFKKIFMFEISNRVSLVALLILLSIYIVFSAGEISSQENLDDYVNVKNRLETWSPNQINEELEPHVRYFLLVSSMALFGSYKVIPFLASIALLIATYLFTKTITNKRFAGIISTVILLQSSIFLEYDTTVSYTNFWILFYIVSLYMVYRFWPLSPVAYLLSIPSKALTAVFMPMSIYFIWRCNIPKKQKIIITTITITIIFAGIIASVGGIITTESFTNEFDEREFQKGLTSFAYQLRFDNLIVLFMIPLIVGLFIVAKNGIRHAESMMIFIAGTLLISPILTGFTEHTNQPYRFVSLVVFFAVSVGVLFSKKQS